MPRAKTSPVEVYQKSLMNCMNLAAERQEESRFDPLWTYLIGIIAKQTDMIQDSLDNGAIP